MSAINYEQLKSHDIRTNISSRGHTNEHSCCEKLNKHGEQVVCLVVKISARYENELASGAVSESKDIYHSTETCKATLILKTPLSLGAHRRNVVAGMLSGSCITASWESSESDMPITPLHSSGAEDHSSANHGGQSFG